MNLPLLVYESHKEAKSKTVTEKKTCFHLSLFQRSKAKKAQSQNYNSILTIIFFFILVCLCINSLDAFLQVLIDLFILASISGHFGQVQKWTRAAAMESRERKRRQEKRKERSFFWLAAMSCSSPINLCPIERDREREGGWESSLRLHFIRTGFSPFCPSSPPLGLFIFSPPHTPKAWEVIIS